MENKETNNITERLGAGITMFVVMCLSLLLLIYVALGESTRTYEKFQGDKLAGQVQIVHNTMQTALKSGLPLKQFVGFNTIAEPILAADQTLSSMTVYDPSGKEVFSVSKDTTDDVKITSSLDFAAKFFVSTSDKKVTLDSGLHLQTDGQEYQILVPLEDKFEKVGMLSVKMPKSVVTDKVTSLFSGLILFAPVIAVVFSCFIVFFGASLQGFRLPWAQITFAGIFVFASGAVIYTMVTLYADGAQSKARALAGSLGQRLNDVVAFNINLDEIEGLDKTFGEYLEVNPDLSAAALTQNGRILIHTDASRIGKKWVSNTDNYEYLVELTPENSVRKVSVAVELPSNVVTTQVLKSVKNFAALFIASAFLATLFFQVGGAVRGSTELLSQKYAEIKEERLLDYVKPVFFLGVLTEHMTYAFLPQYIQASAIKAGVTDALATAPFFGFYLAFALSLIPAGQLAKRIGTRPLMYFGLMLAGIGIIAVTMTENFWTIAVARSISGIGQGMLFIGIQSYLLAVASPQRKTQASAIIVYGFQGGMISGMAVGSLLVSSMGTNGVFTLSAIIAFVAAFYCLIVVPKVVSDTGSDASNAKMLKSLSLAIRNTQFVNTMLTIGVPAKAVLTGIVTYALPLLLAKALYEQADIGQIIMIYAISVVIASRFIAPYVDRLGSARDVLFYGTMLSAAGLGIISYSGLHTAELAITMGAMASTVILIIGIALVGIAHGFINAPVVTFVADSELANKIGAGSATATYRFVERMGHIMGPVLMGVLFTLFDDAWSAVGFVAGAIAILGMFFVASAKDGPSETSSEDDAVMQTRVASIKNN